MEEYDIVVIGAGHNGLTCACYLARAGLKVRLLEMAGDVGGATYTEATIAASPGYRFDRCSTVHNLINMTSIPDELQLEEVGLQYVEMDPFLTTLLPNGDSVRFYRSVDRTCQEIARFSAREAEAYRRFIRRSEPVVELALESLRRSSYGRSAISGWGSRLAATGRLLRHWRPFHLASALLSPYGALLDETFQTRHTTVGVTALAAHGTLGPHVPGTGFFVLFQAAYHRYGNWHARGGSGALAHALRARLEAWGGAVRTGAHVTRIVVRNRVEGVELEDGERIEARRVIAAINPQTALLMLLDPEQMPAELAARLRARHRSNAVQFVVHAALDRLPPWPGAPVDVYRGMQWVAGSVEQVRQNFLEAEAGLAPVNPAVYVLTSSVLDGTLAPQGKHTAYIACPSYPARFADGSTWQARGEVEAHRLLDAVEARAPGFKASITGLAWRHAARWEWEIGLLGGHPMHLDITLDQSGPLRPLPAFASHRGPVAGLYLTGAGTFPTGGVAGAPGRSAARRVLADVRDRRW